jgi:hypothetical protein
MAKPRNCDLIGEFLSGSDGEGCSLGNSGNMLAMTGWSQVHRCVDGPATPMPWTAGESPLRRSFLFADWKSALACLNATKRSITKQKDRQSGTSLAVQIIGVVAAQRIDG